MNNSTLAAIAIVLIVGVLIIISLSRRSENYPSSLTFDQKRENLALAFATFINGTATPIIGGDDAAALETYTDLQKFLDTQVPIAGKWQIVWGPCLYRTGTMFYDNMMTVVRNKFNPLEYKILIRGTNPVAIRSWLLEDFMIRDMVSWKKIVTYDTSNPSDSSSWGYVSAGTVTALLGKDKNLNDVGTVPGKGIVFMTPAPKLSGAGLTIMQFLATIPLPSSGKNLLTITGHSLGGLLSTTLHLFLMDKRKIWDPKSKFTVGSCGFASPTAGDAKFAKHLNSVLKTTTLSINSKLDVASYAWDNLDGLSTIYMYNSTKWYLPSYNLIREVEVFLLIVKELIKNRGYTRLVNTELLEGSFNPLIPEFWAQSLYQHSVAYLNAYSLPMSTFSVFLT